MSSSSSSPSGPAPSGPTSSGPLSPLEQDGMDFSSIPELAEEARNGRMFILLDEHRENEGDLIVPAQMATPDALAFMARQGCGLICLALTKERVVQLGLPLLERRNEERHSTAFTLSIEAREGVTTGISAADRAHTIAVAVNPNNGPGDLVTPGHVFPLMAQDGGVLVRTGHTEAAVDMMRLAGLLPAAVICEILKDDGSMARRGDLFAFAQKFGLRVGTIADLVAYQFKRDRVVERVRELPFEDHLGAGWKCVVYSNRFDGSEHLALIKGDLSSAEENLVRVHALSFPEDLNFGRGGRLQPALDKISAAGQGVLVVIGSNEPSRFFLEQAPPAVLRFYGVGAQILADLGVHQMRILSDNKRSMIGLQGFGLSVSGWQRLTED